VRTRVRTSACVDCETPIIGQQLRCAACHAIAHAPDDVAERPHSFDRAVLVWLALVLVEIIAIAIYGVLLMMKECL
jgi:hypothetical protein